MTDPTPALPQTDLPQAGGSYIRDADGTLRPAPQLAKPTAKGPVKAPVKES